MTTTEERVSIDYKKLVGLLKCAKCSNMFDRASRLPKLLTCSHELCMMCIEEICTQLTVMESNCFPCPTCSEEIMVPQEGTSFPPAHRALQLLDLAESERHEVVSKCTKHPDQDMQFCESCQVIFCNVCLNSSHDQSHNVVPSNFALERAIKVLSQKVQKCINKLELVHVEVSSEIMKLNHNVDRTLENINLAYGEIIDVIDKRRNELLTFTRKIGEDKRKILYDQLQMIEEEKTRIMTQFSEPTSQGDLVAITNDIRELDLQMEFPNIQLDPSENHFITYENLIEPPISTIHKIIENFGCVRSSTTCPRLSEASVEKCFVGMRASAIIVTYDFSGKRQRLGGDSVTATMVGLVQNESIPVHVFDRNDGTYEVKFIVPDPGIYRLKITIFDQLIKNQPLEFEARIYSNPTYLNQVENSGDLSTPKTSISEQTGKPKIMNCSGFEVISSTWARNPDLNSPGAPRVLYCKPLKLEKTRMQIGHATYQALSHLVWIYITSDSYTQILMVNPRENFSIKNSFRIENIIQCVATVPPNWVISSWSCDKKKMDGDKLIGIESKSRENADHETKNIGSKKSADPEFPKENSGLLTKSSENTTKCSTKPVFFGKSISTTTDTTFVNTAPSGSGNTFGQSTGIHSFGSTTAAPLSSVAPNTSLLSTAGQNNTNVNRTNVFSSGNVFSQSTSTPTFGATIASPFGTVAPSTSVFTAGTSTGTGLFGQPQTSQTSLFGSPTTQNVPFGTPAINLPFGATTTSMGSTFGGTSTLLSKEANNPSPNSNSIFNQPKAFTRQVGQPVTTANASVGTTIKFVPVNETDRSMNPPVNTRHQCITVMKEYEDKSMEELRWEDYQATMKGKYQCIQPSCSHLKEVDSSSSLDFSAIQTIWMGAKDGTLYIYREKDERGTLLTQFKLSSPITRIVHLRSKVFIALANGECCIFTNQKTGQWDLSSYYVHNMVEIGAKMQSVEKISNSVNEIESIDSKLADANTSIGCMEAAESSIWIGYQNLIYILDYEGLFFVDKIIVNSRKEAEVTQLTAAKGGVWCCSQKSSIIRFYSSSMPYQQIHFIDIQTLVASIPSPVSSCSIEITALEISNDHLWIGTTIGHILNIPITRAFQDFFTLRCKPSQIQLSLHSHGSGVKFFLRVQNLMISGGQGYRNLTLGLDSEVNVVEEDCPHVIVWEEK